MTYFLIRIVYLHFYGNNIWSKMLDKKRRLPDNTFSEYLLNQQKDV